MRLGISQLRLNVDKFEPKGPRKRTYLKDLKGPEDLTELVKDLTILDSKREFERQNKEQIHFRPDWIGGS